MIGTSEWYREGVRFFDTAELPLLPSNSSRTLLVLDGLAGQS